MTEDLERKYLEEWRKAKYWSQSDLSKAAEVSQSIVSRIEKGEKIGRFATLVKIADALGVKPEQILEFAPVFEIKKDPPVVAVVSDTGGISAASAVTLATAT